jgi:thermitase
VIAVAACNHDRQIWKSSATGPTVDVTGPGENVYVARATTTDLEEVKPGSGTSFAVATTAGICALWLAHHGRDRLIARYGKANLAAVFKEVLLTAGVDGSPVGGKPWDTSKWGKGTVQAEELLAAPLPATAPAGGIESLKASPVPVRQNDFDDIVAYLPGADPRVVHDRLVTALHTTGQELPSVLARHGKELAFHAAFDPAFRRALTAPVVGAPGRSKAKSAKSTKSKVVAAFARNPWLTASASASLKAAMQL